jgi:hypothetical protein
MSLALVILIVGTVLIVYTLVEKRINQRTCPDCGYRVSADSPSGECPRCLAGDTGAGDTASSYDLNAQSPSRKILSNWPRLVFIGVPLLIIFVSSGLLLSDHYQSEMDKAIRLVKESNSRKENFNVQQYLYATVYHRRAEGEAITITGWRVSAPPDEHSEATVDFVYSDAEGEHVATWGASVSEGRVSARNEAARELSWH